MQNITSSIEIITPEIASHYIQKNRDNRPLSPSIVNNYAATMERGSWMFNGDSIRFDEDGYLLDGQHRLYAVMQSGTSMQCFIIRGIPREVFTTIDIGRGRRLADFIALEGYKQSLNMGAALRWVWNYRENKFINISGKLVADTRQLLDLLKNEDGLKESINFIGRLQSRQKVINLSPAAAFHHIFSEKEEFLATNFFEQLYTGANLSPDSPILSLRNQQMNIRMGSINQSKKHLVISVIKAWNHYIENKPLSLLKVGATEDVSEIKSRHPELKLSA